METNYLSYKVWIAACFLKYKTDNITQGHSWSLANERCKLDMIKYAFSQRTIHEWNRLPEECVNATSVKYVQE